MTGWLVLDPLIALAVATNIVWTGLQLLRETGSGLLDRSLPQKEREKIWEILCVHEQRGIQFHALMTRLGGSRRFISFHVLVPGAWTVARGHTLCEEIELAIIEALPGSYVITHLEPREDPVSWQDQTLDRSVEVP